MADKNPISAKKVIKTAIIIELSDIILNMVAAIFSGSMVMLGEMLQGLSDLMSDLFLFIGINNSKKINDKKYAFGQGRSIYFYAFISAIIMLLISSVLTFYFGFKRFTQPEPIKNIFLAYAVLAISIITNSYSFSLSFRRILKNNKIKNFFKIYKESLMVETKSTLSLDLTGIMVALFGLISLIIYGITGNSKFDGVGAMVIAIFLAILSIDLLKKTKELMIGSRAPKKLEEKIKKSALEIEGVLKVLDLKTMNIGVGKILVNIEIHANPDLKTKQIEKLTDKVKENIKKNCPQASHVLVEIETP